MTGCLTIILAAGGTGGHVFPAVAVAEALTARGHKVVVATDKRGARFEGDIETVRIAAGGLGGSMFAKLRDAVAIGIGAIQAGKLILGRRAHVVIGFGGYPSLPTMLAAILLRRPTLIHEQNAVLGRVNRLIASRVGRIATAVPTVKGAPAGAVSFVGNPVRQTVADVGQSGYAAPAPAGRINLLVFGGSQGARVLSDVVPAAIAQLPEDLRARLDIAQQCRPEDIDRVGDAYRSANLGADLQTFFGDMPARLAAAHLVVARSGASTVAELAAAGRPALLIPFAGAMDDHQTANAEALVAAGAAVRIAEADATPETVASALLSLLTDSGRLHDAAAAARAIARPDAAESLADLIEATAQSRNAPRQNRPAEGIAA